MKDNAIYKAFPQALQQCVANIQKGTNLNGEFLLGSMLYASSVAIGNTYKIQVLESWVQSCNLYMVIVGKTGMSKSPAINIALKPLNERNRELALDYKRALSKFNALDKVEKDGELPPIRKQIAIEDATLEAIYRILDNNPRGVGLCYDEIIVFFNNLSRYSTGSDQQQWLKLWSGSPLNVDRVNSGTYYVQSPFVGFIGGIQPKVLPQLSKDDRDKNGFLERILFVYPDKVKRESFPIEQTPVHVFQSYDRIINRLLDLEMLDEDGMQSNVVHFTQEALSYYRGFYNTVVKMTNSCEDNDPLAGFYPKIQSYCARFALILQLLYWSCDEGRKDEISLRATKGAVNICEYFLDNASKALIKNDSPELTKDQKKQVAKHMVSLQNYGTREIGKILGVSHTTVNNWINGG